MAANKSYKNFLHGIAIVAKNSANNGYLGDLEVLKSPATPANTLNFHNGTSSSQILTVVHAAQGVQKVLNKDLDDATTRIINGTSTPKALVFDISGANNSTTTTLDFNQTANRIITFPDTTDTLVARNTTDTLSHKTLTAPVINNATADTITGITGGPLLIQSDTDENVTLQAQGTGNLSLQAAGSGNVLLEGLTVNGTTVTGSNISVSSTGTLGLSASTSATLTATSGTLGLNAGTLLTLTGPTGVKTVGPMLVNEVVDNTTTGSNISIATSPYISFTNGGLTTIDTIVNNGDNSFLVITNRTGNTVTINNNTGATASNRIITGTGSFLNLDNNASIMLAYSNANSRWMIVGGTGAGGNASVNLVAGENITAGQAVYVSNGTGTDSGRTAGRVYLLDPTNDDRVEFLGFASNTATTGSTIRIQTIGSIGGLSGLTIGKPVYASVTTPGAVQTSAPIAVNQWIIPVGIALDVSSAAINGAGSSTAVKITGTIIDGLYADVQTYTSNQSITNANSVVLVNATAGVVTITLPSASLPDNKGKVFNIKKIDSTANAVNIVVTGGATIDGLATQSLTFQYDSFMIVSNGTNYNII